MALTTQQVQTFYIAYLARAGESAGVNAWSAPTFNITEAEAAAAFFNSPEATALYPTARTDVAAYVDAVYNNLFGRAAEPAGKAAWVNYINSGAITIEQVPYVIATGAANEDLQALNGKITAATQYTNQVGANYNTDAARAMLKKITSTDPASYTPEAIAADLAEALNNVSPGPTPGGTFMLTAGVDVASTNVAYHGNMQNPDTFRFTDANETIEATTLTLGSGDNFTDGNDKDKDVLHIVLQNYDVSKTIGSTGVGSDAAAISGIEVLDIDATAGGANNIVYAGSGKLGASITDLIIRGAFDASAGGTGLSVSVGSADSALKTVDLTGVSYAGGSGGLVFNANTNPNDLTISGPSFNASITGGNGNDTITGQGTIDGGSGNDIITGKGDIKGSAGNDTITATGLSTVEGGAGNDTISGYGVIYGDIASESSVSTASGGDDIITLTGVSTVVGGAGADTITTSTEGVVTFKNFKKQTATISSGADVEVADIYKEVVGAAVKADTYTVKVGDKIDISGAVLGSGGNLLNGGNAYSATEKVAVSSASGTGDVFLLKNGADYFLVYEASGAGNSASLGSGAEVIKLVGLTDANKITLDTANGIVTIV